MVTILGSMVNIPHSYLTQFMQLFVLYLYVSSLRQLCIRFEIQSVKLNKLISLLFLA